MACAAPSTEMDEILKQAGLSETDGPQEDDTKIVVVGNKGCGKTSLVEAFVTEDRLYPENPTFGSSRKRVVTANTVFEFVLRELPPSDDHAGIRAQAYPGSKVVLLCFAVDDPTSFHAVPKWNAEIRRYLPDAKIILLGCKMDKREDQGPVNRREAKALAKVIRALKYYECSAVTGKNVADLSLIIESKLRV